MVIISAESLKVHQSANQTQQKLTGMLNTPKVKPEPMEDLAAIRELPANTQRTRGISKWW